MGLEIIGKTIEAVGIRRPLFHEEETKFVVEFAFKTNDSDLTNKLIDELTNPDRDFEAIRRKYETMYDIKPSWINQIENLLISLEMYRIEEEKAVNRISEILNAYGVFIGPDEIRESEIKELKDLIKKERK